MWMKALLGRVFSVVDFPLSFLYIYCITPFWTVEFLFKSNCCSFNKMCPTFCTPMNAACQVSLLFITSWSLLKLMSIESVILSNHLTLCCPLTLLPSIFPSIKVFSNESVLCIRWPKYWSLSFMHQSFQWIFRVDFL